jgi:acetyl/propionyl-CoA carboxylase alpha subunit
VHLRLSCPPQIRGIKTNIPFLENVLRHPEFLAGEAKTSFIEKNAQELFNFEGHGSLRSSKLLVGVKWGEGSTCGGNTCVCAWLATCNA